MASPVLSPLKKTDSLIPGLTSQTFSHHMAAMKLHYTIDSRGGATHPYQLPIQLTHPIDKHGTFIEVQKFPTIKEINQHKELNQKGKLGGDIHKVRGKVVLISLRELEAKSKMQDVTKELNKRIEQMYSNAESSIQIALKQLNSDHDVQGFRDKLNASKEQLKDQLNEAIDVEYDKIGKIALAVPAVQPMALSVTQKIGLLITSLAASFATFMTNLVAAVVSAIKSAVEWLANAAQDVVDFVGDTASSVADAITGLFD